MTTQQIGLLLVQLLASLFVLASIGVLLLQGHEEKIKFRLYAVRDKLLYLKATGLIRDDSLVFKVFYRAMNTYVSQLDSLTMVSFLRAAHAAKTELEKANRERLIEEWVHSPMEVQEAINDFINLVMEALRYNSPMLHIVLAVVRHCHRLVSFLRSRFTLDIPVYRTYRYYESMHGSLAAHPYPVPQLV
ncbi:MAG: hypothetical protein ABSH32_16955 [Bryobacteraceae bacterium]